MLTPSLAADPWALARRPPVVIAADEVESVERQWAIYASMTPQARLNLGLQMSEVALAQRRARLQRAFSTADATGISWAVVSEVLRLEPRTAPVAR